MNDLYIYKMLAYSDELVTLPSSYDEFQAFLACVARPDFADKNVICVKFLFSIIPDCLDDAEETTWYINPSSVKVPLYCTRDSYGPKLPSEYPPFLLLLAAEYPNKSLLREYDCSFDITDNTKYDWRANYAESFKILTNWCKENL